MFLRNSPSTVQDLTLTLPYVGELERIGDLWDCVNSKKEVGNIFDESQIENHDYLEAVPVHDMKYHLSRVKDSQGKSEILAISVELAFELAGVIAVEGAASFKVEDSKSFEEDEFFCTYDLQTYVVRTRPTVSDPTRTVINADVKRKIQNREIKATHYVSEVRYGANAIARLRIRDSLNHDLLELSGTFGGKMPIGPITIGLKASIAFKEQESEANFSSDIKLTSRPDLGEFPSNIEEMFKTVEKLPSALENQLPNYPELFPSPPIVGVPVVFKLSPIKNLFPPPEDDPYFILEQEVLASYSEMIFILLDFERPHSYRNLIREIDPRLAALFPKDEGKQGDGSKNPWANDVDIFQNEKKRVALALKEEAQILMTKYKQGAVSIDQIIAIVNKYKKDFNYNQILSKATIDADKGREVLRGLRTADAVGCGVPNLFIFSEYELDDFINGDRGIRLLLKTKGTGPQGAYTNLYSIASALESLGIRIGVACPNIPTASEFSLTFKINDRKFEYSGEQINNTLWILTQIVNARSRNFSPATILLNLLSSTEFQIPLNELSLEDFGDFIANVSNNLNDIKLPENYLRTLEVLMNLEKIQPKLTILYLTQYPLASEKCWNFYKRLKEFKRKGTSIEFVNASLEIGSHLSNSPIAIILDQNQNVAGLCQDKLDELLVQRLLQLDDQNDNGWSVISLDSIGNYSLSLTGTFGFEIAKLLGYKQTPVIMIGSPFDVLFPTEQAEAAFNIANRLLIAASICPVEEIVSVVAKGISARLIFEGKLIPILEKAGYTEQSGFSPGTEWKPFLENLKEVESELFPPEEEVAINDEGERLLLQQFIAIAQFAAEGSDNLLNNVLKFFIGKFFQEIDFAGDELHFKILELLDNQMPLALGIFKCLPLLNLASYNLNFLHLFETLENLTTLDDPEELMSLLELLSTFSEDEKEWIWRNPKIQYWVEIHSKNKMFVAKVFDLFCQEGDSIPKWIPDFLRSSLRQLRIEFSKSLTVWETKWESVDKMVETFGLLLQQEIVPEQFMNVLSEQASFFSVDMPLDTNPPFISIDPTCDLKNFHNEIKKLLPFIWKNVRNENSLVLEHGEVADYFGYEKNKEGNKMEINRKEVKTKMPFALPIPKNFVTSFNCFGVFSNSNNENYVYKPLDCHGDFENKHFVSRSDLLQLLLDSLRMMDNETIAMIQIVSILSNTNKIAIPWIFRLEKFQTLLPTLQNVTSFGSQIQRFLTPPVKLITAIRVGSRPNLGVGKSTLINLSVLNHGQFASKFEPGYKIGKPLNRSGLLELLWLNEETVNSEFYEKVLKDYYVRHHHPVQLANFHGEFTNQELPTDILEELLTHTNSFLVFWECNDWEEVESVRMELNSIIGREKLRLDVYLNPDATTAARVPPSSVINTESEDSFRKMRHILKQCLLMTGPTLEANSNPFKKAEYEKLLDAISSNSVQLVRSCLKLQDKPSDWEQLIEKPLWQEVLTCFVSVIILPFPQNVESLRNLQHWLKQVCSPACDQIEDDLTAIRKQLATQTFDNYQIETATALEVENLRNNWLSPRHFLDELIILSERDEDHPLVHGYTLTLRQIFAAGLFPIGLTFGVGSQTLKVLLNSIPVKAYFISLLNFGMKRARDLLKILFGIDNMDISMGKDEISMQFLPFNSTMEAQWGQGGEVNGFVLLYANDLGSPDGDLWDKAEICAFLLSIANFSMAVFEEGSNDIMKETLSQGLIAQQLFEGDTQRGSLVLVNVDSDVGPKLGINENEFVDIIAMAENLGSSMPIVGNMRKSVFENLEKVVIACFDSKLMHKVILNEDGQICIDSVKPLETEILHALKSSKPKSISSWFQDASLLWNNLKTRNVQKKFRTVSNQHLSNVENRIVISELRSLIEEAFKSHESIIRAQLEEDEYEEGEDEENQIKESVEEIIKILNRVPFNCTLHPSEGCKCREISESMQTIQKRFKSLRKELDGELLKDELEQYCARLRVDLISSLPFTTNNVGKRGDKNLNSAWKEGILEEIEREYGPSVLDRVERGELIELDEILAFDLRHEGNLFDIFSHARDKCLAEYLSWEPAIWLELKIKSGLRNMMQKEERYYLGMIREVRLFIQNLLENDFYNFNGDHEVLMKNFVWKVHTFALVIFMEFWEEKYTEISPKLNNCKLHSN